MTAPVDAIRGLAARQMALMRGELHLRPTQSNAALSACARNEDAGPVLCYILVEEGSTERLCEEAAHSVSQLILLFTPPSVQGVFKSSFASKAEGLVDKAIAKGQVYFCEMGLGSPPDFGPEIETNAKEACDKKKTEAESAANQAGANYTTRCRGLGIPCDGTEASSNTLTPTQKAELANLRATRDAATQQVSGFDQDKCVKDKKAEAQKNLDANDPDNNTGTSQTKDPGGGANGNNAPSPSKDAKNPGKSREDSGQERGQQRRHDPQEGHTGLHERRQPRSARGGGARG